MCCGGWVCSIATVINLVELSQICMVAEQPSFPQCSDVVEPLNFPHFWCGDVEVIAL